MSVTKLTLTWIVAGVASGLFLLDRHAVTQDVHWQYGSIIEEGTGRFQGKVLMTDDHNQAGVVFWCSDDRLLPGFSPEGTDFTKIFRLDSNLRAKRVRLKINGEEVSREKWTHFVEFDVLVPRDRKTRYQIYNAVVRNEEISISLKKNEWITPNIPPKDSEKFGAFKTGCGFNK